MNWWKNIANTTSRRDGKHDRRFCCRTLLVGLQAAGAAGGLMVATVGFAQEPAATKPVPVPEMLQPVPLNPEGTVLFDKSNGKLLLKTKVCLREGQLEMLLCPVKTKEHESILSIDAKAQVIHAGLLALGAKAGRPAKFTPDYEPPQGQVIEIVIRWQDADGSTHRWKAQELIRHAIHRYFETPLEQLPAGVSFPRGDGQLIFDADNKQLLFFGPMSASRKREFLALSQDADYQKAVETLAAQGKSHPLEADFIFAGSGFSKLKNGTEVYQAEGGSLICVANFGDALLDINMKSSASNDLGLLFEPWTERLPALQADVTVELIPVTDKPTGSPGGTRTMQ